MACIVDPDFKYFHTQNSFSQRKRLSERIKVLYPDKVPVIVTRGSLNNTPRIVKHKFLSPNDITLAKFMVEIRKHFVDDVNAATAIFCFVRGSVLPPVSISMQQLYITNVDSDGFLYITYSGENTFG